MLHSRVEINIRASLLQCTFQSKHHFFQAKWLIIFQTIETDVKSIDIVSVCYHSIKSDANKVKCLLVRWILVLWCSWSIQFPSDFVNKFFFSWIWSKDKQFLKGKQKELLISEIIPCRRKRSLPMSGNFIFENWISVWSKLHIYFVGTIWAHSKVEWRWWIFFRMKSDYKIIALLIMKRKLEYDLPYSNSNIATVFERRKTSSKNINEMNPSTRNTRTDGWIPVTKMFPTKFPLWNEKWRIWIY